MEMVYNRNVFFFQFLISVLRVVLVFSFISAPHATMFEMVTSLCSIFRLSAVVIIRLDSASGVSSSKGSLVSSCSMYKDWPNACFRLIPITCGLHVHLHVLLIDLVNN